MEFMVVCGVNFAVLILINKPITTLSTTGTHLNTYEDTKITNNQRVNDQNIKNRVHLEDDSSPSQIGQTGKN